MTRDPLDATPAMGREWRHRHLAPEQIAEPLSDREERDLRQQLADGTYWVGPHRTARLLASLDAARLAAIPAKPDVGDGLREATKAVIDAARELNLTMPDMGDGDPLSDLDDALIAYDDAAALSREPSTRGPSIDTETRHLREQDAGR